VHQVSPLDGRLRLLLDTVGPTLGAFGALGFGVSRCRTTWNPHPSNSRMPKHRRDQIIRHVSFRWTAAILSCIRYGHYPSCYSQRNSTNRDFPPTADLLLRMNLDRRQYTFTRLLAWALEMRFSHVALGRFSCNLQTWISLCRRQVMLLTLGSMGDRVVPVML
jgi:hypothetical protein